MSALVWVLRLLPLPGWHGESDALRIAQKRRFWAASFACGHCVESAFSACSERFAIVDQLYAAFVDTGQALTIRSLQILVLRVMRA